jgi:hypothetical protein
VYDNTGRIVERSDDKTPRVVEHADTAARKGSPAGRKATPPVGASVAMPARAVEQPREIAPARRNNAPARNNKAARVVGTAADKSTRIVAPASNKAPRVVEAPADNVVRVVLIACSKTKRAGRHPARSLYQGALFKAALAHAQRIGAETFVVSAKHGLVHLDTELDAYEHRLRPTERESWAYGVSVALRQRMKRRRYAVTIFAGETYAAPLEKYIAVLDPTIEVCTPLAGLSLGSQLRWFRLAAGLAGGAQ